MNERAVELAMILGRALGCEVNRSVMARKNYFYPDMPKDFQTTQYDQPTNSEGHLELADGFVVGIERAHIEEDTGKSIHVGGGGRINDAVYSLVDYNRAGVPLIEIVSKPDIRTIEHARNYVEELRAIVVATGVSDRANGPGFDPGRCQRFGSPAWFVRTAHPLRNQEHQLDTVARSCY